MKIFLFTDKSLDSGHLIVKGKNTKIKLVDLEDFNEILFVLPNEILTFVKHDANLKNRSNLYASIINSVNTVNIDEKSELQVLRSSNSQKNFYTIKKDNLRLFKEKFKHADSKIMMTSDLLFFREIFNANISFNNSIFYIEGENLIKLTEQAFSLLEQTNLEITPKSFVDINIDPNKKVSFHEFDLFNFQNIFSFSVVKKWIYTAISLIVLLNLVGLFNIISNWNQIKQMDNTLADLYLSIYPDEDVVSLEEQLATKFNTLDVETSSITSKISQLTLDIAAAAEVMELSFNNDDGQYLLVKCIFQSASEEKIFIANQQSNNLTISVVDRADSNDIVVTQFRYEL